MKRNVLFILIIVFSSSCNFCRKKTLQIKSVDLETVTPDTLVYGEIFDESRNGLEAVCKFIGLSNLQNDQGNEDEIRFWFGYDRSDRARIIVFKKIGGSWQSMIYFLKYSNDEKFYITSVEKRTEQGQPKSGWNVFFNKLEGLGLSKLKNFDKIPGYTLTTGGDQITIEIRKDNKYNRYEYPNYLVHLTETPLKEADEVYEMALLMQEEFGYRLYPRPPIEY